MAWARLPLEAARYARRRAVEGHQIQGYGRYDLPLLASYSRSGTNWIRFIIETISERPTPGTVRVHHGTDFVIDRAHQAYVEMAKYERVILVIRDYRECLLRHHEQLWTAHPDVATFMATTSCEQPPSWYLDNIRAFDRHGGDNLLVYYEDLLGDPDPSIRRLADYLGLDPARTTEFLETRVERQHDSVRSYTDKGHDSFTGDRIGGQAGYHAGRLLQPGQAAEFDTWLRAADPALFDRYLSRYTVGGTPSPT